MTQFYTYAGLAEKEDFLPPWHTEPDAGAGSRRPDLLKIQTDLANGWFGVTVTRRSEQQLSFGPVFCFRPG